MFVIREIFETLQGEGSKAGTPAIFVRFTGCNLWSGNERLRERGKGECANWCDTDFFKGQKFSCLRLIEILENATKGWKSKTVVFTGGEPTLQLKSSDGEYLVKVLLQENWNVCIETNGTMSLDDCSALNLIYKAKNGHITMSPKMLKNSESIEHIKLTKGTDLKIITPSNIPINKFVEMEFKNFYLQPLDNKDGSIGLSNLENAIHLCQKYGFKISIQTHKLIGLQ